ncbi:MAG: hypothetical protein E6J41_14325 [Chloroflexi bacterium]|nr:MAG: hypothetical protein E6J41_14325 [Chloroflexota bacterium]
MDLPPRDALQARIEHLDLAVVRRRLMNEHGWDSAAATAAEDQYRRFLVSAATVDTISPNREADAFWHEHILHTEKYAADCELVFGRLLHHDPLEKPDGGYCHGVWA